MPTIIIPTPLRKFVQNQSKINLEGHTIQEVINSLILNFPDLKKHLLDDQGVLRTYVNVFLGDEDIRNLDKEKTKTNAQSVLSIIPAIAGGTIQ